MRLFSEHPNSVGESYFQHMATAASFAGWMALGSVLCFCHAFLPFLFTRSGSAIIERMHHDMVCHRKRAVAGTANTSTAEPTKV